LNVVIDTNAVISAVTGRDERQFAMTQALLLSAEEGHDVIVLPQLVVFEMSYVLRQIYNTPPAKLAAIIRDAITLPGLIVIDDCPWPYVLELWPQPFESIADAALVAIAISNRYDAIATFDQRLVRRAKPLGVNAYW